MAPYRQFSNVQNLGDKKYFPLRISRFEISEDGSRETTRVHERFVFLTSYEEVFECNWTTEFGGYGRLNQDYRYSQTTRRANITFKLPARNVAEAKKNLDFCSDLANLVYGDYQRRQSSLAANEDSDAEQPPGQFTYNGASLNTKVKFGNLLRNELCFFKDYSFTPNMDAGVFEYNGTEVGVAVRQNEDSPATVGQLQEQHFQNDMGPGALIEETQFVYHNQKGKVYPREVEVSLSMTILSETPLGFGGALRGPLYPLRWAQNEYKDWPHGTGPIGIMRYMQPNTRPTQPAYDLNQERDTYVGESFGQGFDERLRYRDSSGILLKRDGGELAERLGVTGYSIDENGNVVLTRE